MSEPVTIRVDDSAVRRDEAMRRAFVADGGCAMLWLGDARACRADRCCLSDEPL